MWMRGISVVGATVAVVIGLLDLWQAHGTHLVAILAFPILCVIADIVYNRQGRRLILAYQGLFFALTGAEFFYWARLHSTTAWSFVVFATILVALVLLLGILTLIREQSKLHQWWDYFKALWRP